MIRPAVLLAFTLLAAPGEERTFRSSNVKDMEELASVLKRRVAYLELKVHPRPGELLLDPLRDGFGAVIGPRRVVAPSFLFEEVDAIQVIGPKGRAAGKLVLSVPELRVALIDVEVPLERLGLEPSQAAPLASRALDQTVFALVSTMPESGVQAGTVTDDGKAEELEGHVRTTLRLAAGMPAFDDHARLLGISRTAAWDHEKTLLFTLEHVEEARTSTRPAKPPPPKKADEAPWWTKKEKR